MGPSAIHPTAAPTTGDLPSTNSREDKAREEQMLYPFLLPPLLPQPLQGNSHSYPCPNTHSHFGDRHPIFTRLEDFRPFTSFEDSRPLGLVDCGKGYALPFQQNPQPSLPVTSTPARPSDCPSARGSDLTSNGYSGVCSRAGEGLVILSLALVLLALEMEV